ncbi:MAG: tetratricopeptide repeat protein [Microscillaceae bacterium]|nr:tetratricopeptide repeat protein [Microscillaceae bacterium]MDW8459630.1 tetratricopeptide repeat protein [Cytophagales bacterium]
MFANSIARQLYFCRFCLIRGITILVIACICFSPAPAQQTTISELLAQLNQAKKDEQKINLQNQIALEYQKQEAHSKAIEYYQKSYNLLKNTDKNSQKIAILKGIALSQVQIKDYKNAIQTQKEILAIYKQQNDNPNIVSTLQEIANLNRIEGNYQDALQNNLEILEVYQKNSQIQNQNNLALTYNNIGYLYRQLGDNTQSAKYFDRALEINSKLPQAQNQQVLTLLNRGVTFSNTNSFKLAEQQYNEALKIAEKNNNKQQIATINNYLAANAYIAGNNTQALEYAQRAIEIAEPNQMEDVMMISYKILSDVYSKEDDLRQSQKYYKLYQDLKEKANQKGIKQQQQLMERQVEVEKKESEIKSILAENERKEAQIRESKLEAEKKQQELILKEQELALLKERESRQQAEIRNQQLEKDRLQQLLALTQQRAEAERQRQEISLLQKNKELQDIKLKEQAAQDEARKKALEAAEKDRQLVKQRLEDEAKIKLYLYGVLALIALVLILVIVGLINARRTSKKLREQNEEIEAQRQEILTNNEELQQSQEEIIAQRDYIEAQNKELRRSQELLEQHMAVLAEANEKLRNNEAILRESYEKIKRSEETIREQNKVLQDINSRINSSIKAALTIQKAILPYQAKMEALFHDYFVLYRPKDIVSGDFYWINKIEDKIFVIAADCTGHGVPGAFMTLIGNNLLDKIIRVWDIHNPAQILNRLHDEVQTVLRQKDTSNNSGMDLAVVVYRALDTQTLEITFSGAKRPLYYLPKGETKIQELKGDRKSIGGEQNEEKEFTNQVIQLPVDSILYMCSDGFADQNNDKRKRFGEKQMLEILEKNSHLPLKEQHTALEKAMQEHIQNTEQRDDMLVLGIQII